MSEIDVPGTAITIGKVRLFDELVAALEAVQDDAVNIGRGENAISDDVRAKVDEALTKAKALRSLTTRGQ